MMKISVDQAKNMFYQQLYKLRQTPLTGLITDLEVLQKIQQTEKILHILEGIKEAVHLGETLSLRIPGESFKFRAVSHKIFYKDKRNFPDIICAETAIRYGCNLEVVE